MGSTAIRFSARVRIREEIIPIKSELVFGNEASEDGITNGFIFTLDYEPGDDPVQIDLGAIINFIETALDGGNLSTNPGMAELTQAFPGQVSPSTFNSSNTTQVLIREFTINSSDREKLFSFNIDIQGSDPEAGLIALPAELNNWIKIKDLGIAFSASTRSES
ncbi:hypothetical protein [Algoriphagus resistens]|uniref:hypothetical protein n=1 Tax=Algoriphagus resistens TaxID=1750590 RepID=UPI0007167F73|nr:hypothetical protein [Algoriphagus resistens]